MELHNDLFPLKKNDDVRAICDWLEFAPERLISYHSALTKIQKLQNLKKKKKKFLYRSVLPEIG